jgi:hypothetical protein
MKKILLLSAILFASTCSVFGGLEKPTRATRHTKLGIGVQKKKARTKQLVTLETGYEISESSFNFWIKKLGKVFATEFEYNQLTPGKEKIGHEAIDLLSYTSLVRRKDSFFQSKQCLKLLKQYKLLNDKDKIINDDLFYIAQNIAYCFAPDKRYTQRYTFKLVINTKDEKGRTKSIQLKNREPIIVDKDLNPIQQ